MPESMSSWGVLKTPAETTTSFAKTRFVAGMGAAWGARGSAR